MNLRLDRKRLRNIGSVLHASVLIGCGLVATSVVAKAQQTGASAGSIFLATGPLANPARDLRASLVGDIVTIVVSDQANAVATGGSKTKRDSSASNQITALMGTLAPGSPLANLLNFARTQQLQGQGQTTRALTLTTTISAQVVATLGNGILLLEATKEITVNSERQVVAIKGYARQVDITPANTILSDQISNMTLSVNGKGIVDDAIKKRFSLFRIFTDFLPF